MRITDRARQASGRAAGPGGVSARRLRAGPPQVAGIASYHQNAVSGQTRGRQQ